MINNEIDLRIVDSVFDPRGSNKDTVYFKNRNYQVFLYLAGRDLPYVEDVTYQLHESFKRNKIKIRRTVDNPECVLAIWTWGLFQVRATVRFKDGRFSKLSHQLAWDKQITTSMKQESVI